MQKYTCPMHPQVLKDEPGKCPLCGMALIPVGKPSAPHKHKMDHEHTGHSHHDTTKEHVNKHEGHHTADFLKRFWISVIITVPILLLSDMIQEWAGFHFTFPGDDYVLLTLGTVIFGYGGLPFLKGMIGEIKAKAIGMMTLVAIAISVAYSYSVAVVFGLPGMDFFWELATLIVIMLLGHWLEMRSQMAASRALQSLVALLPNDVTVERNGEAVKIKLEDLQRGETAIIKPGEKIPADGLVTDGLSYINESMLTGESAPVKKEANSKVIAGAINGDGALRIKVTAVGKDSYLNRVINLVQEAQATKSNTQNLADQVAKWLTFIAIAVGLGTFAYWFAANGDTAFALERMVTVMVTACPHALGVAIPLVVAISTTLSATNGLLIRNRTAFEATRKLSTVIFDKTGTLTKGSHAVERIIPLTKDYNADKIIQYAAAVQQNSEHHIAKGIMATLKEKNLALWKSDHFSYMQGIGVKGVVDGKSVAAVGPNYFNESKLSLPEIPKEINQEAETVNFVFIEDQLAGIVTLADSIREGSQQAVDELRKMNIQSFLLTGDNEKIAAAVAGKLGMDGYLANVLPHHKQEKVKEFQAQGEIVAMTGDGVNDAPALAQAEVGIAVGSGTDVAAETADIILVDSDPRDVVKLIDFGKRTYKKMVQNLIWAVGYNVVAIPLAAGLLYPNFVLSPAMGAVLMSVSTVVVAINASLLKINKKNELKMKNITLFTAAAIIVITAASCNQLSNKNGQSVQDAVAVGDTIGFSIAPIITDYLSLKNALVSDDDKAAASAGKELFATFTTMDMKSIPIDKHQPYMDIAESAKENAAHIGENIGNIGHQREHLALLSEDLSDLIALFGTSQPLHQARCPMFNGGKGAIWLSEAEAIQNPYYGSQMLTCGSVEKTISMH